MAFNNTDTDTRRKRPKPVDYDQLYPGRFIRAGELLDKKVTLTITDVDMEDLMGEDNKPKAKATVAFKETEKQLVMCKTNGMSIKAMFGKKLSDWIGKRVTLFPDTWNGEPCTRVWGSPDIQQDIEVEIALPRRRPFKKTMHAMGKANGAVKSSTLPPLQQSIDVLRNTKSVVEFNIAKESVWNLYIAAGKDVPVELEGAANDHAETLGQNEEPTL
jgi:hypothetical protein